MDTSKINLIDELAGAQRVGIAGHVRPDGDCIGSCMALYEYIKNNKQAFGIKHIDVRLETIGNEFHILKNTEIIKNIFEDTEPYDVFISLDCGSIDRLGKAQKYFKEAKKTINIDHHISNDFFGDVNYIIPEASSTCEVLYGLLEEEKITKQIAECLYLGIIHDTGVFKHSNTSKWTMEVAGVLMGKGIEFSKIIDKTFFQKTFMQNQLLGRCLMESFLVLDGKVVVSVVTSKVLDFYKASSGDTDGIIDQLRLTKGTQVAIFIYEIEPGRYKVSMRSNEEVNVSKIAVYFGGGGHIKAAGCTMNGSVHDVINNLTPHIEAQLENGE